MTTLQPPADNAVQRLNGIVDAIAGHNIEVIDKREDNTDRAKARANVEDIVNAHHDLAMVVGLWNYNGPAIAAALDGLGKKGKVLAAVFDEDDGTLDGIESGAIQATVVQKPFMFGYLASLRRRRSDDIRGRAKTRSRPASRK